MTPWTYEGYWNLVLGASRSAADVVNDFDLDHASRRELDEWLGHAESDARAEGGDAGPRPETWSSYHERALSALREAAS